MYNVQIHKNVISSCMVWQQCARIQLKIFLHCALKASSLEIIQSFFLLLGGEVNLYIAFILPHLKCIVFFISIDTLVKSLLRWKVGNSFIPNISFWAFFAKTTSAASYFILFHIICILVTHPLHVFFFVHSFLKILSKRYFLLYYFHPWKLNLCQSCAALNADRNFHSKYIILYVDYLKRRQFYSFFIPSQIINKLD